MRKETLLSVGTMLMVSPIAAVTTMFCLHPDRWGGNPMNILGMAIFGLITVQLWPTYIPTLILTPFIMRRIAAHRVFRTSSVPALLLAASVIGAASGVCVLAPIILITSRDSRELASGWMSAGGISGALTLMLIVAIYRFVAARAEPSAPPNGGPAAPPVIPSITEGRHR